MAHSKNGNPCLSSVCFEMPLIWNLSSFLVTPNSQTDLSWNLKFLMRCNGNKTWNWFQNVSSQNWFPILFLVQRCSKIRARAGINNPRIKKKNEILTISECPMAISYFHSKLNLCLWCLVVTPLSFWISCLSITFFSLYDLKVKGQTLIIILVLDSSYLWARLAVFCYFACITYVICKVL